MARRGAGEVEVSDAGAGGVRKELASFLRDKGSDAYGNLRGILAQLHDGSYSFIGGGYLSKTENYFITIPSIHVT